MLALLLIRLLSPIIPQPREDFSISYKGVVPAGALPLRNWDEANLPKPLKKVWRSLPAS